MRTRALAGAAVLALVAVLVLPATAASARSISRANLKALTNSINRAKNLTYQATYTSVNGGQTSTVTIAQSPPKSNFSTSSGQVINDGKNTYYCSTSGSGSGNSGSSGSTGSSGNSGSTSSTSKTGAVQCISVKGSNPLLGLESAFSPALALQAFSEAQQGLVSRLFGIKVSSSSATYAGQPSTCVTVNVRGRSGKYCVTKQGLLAYAGASSASYFQLTKYSSSPASSLFSLPAGATTKTLPSGGSVP
jgi:hypothetical protein